MGILHSNASFYLDARARGVCFDRTLTLGRQRFYVRPAELEVLSSRYRPELRNQTDDVAFGEPADAFFERFLEVRELAALDHSAYEGSRLIHDLNHPIPAELAGRFDVVIDSGTLEHIFNLPIALTNCMRLVKEGGTLFLSTPTNNMCGHGFYQFSPELFFRVLVGSNGFSLTRLVLVTHPFPGGELGGPQTQYEVIDPEVLGERVPLMTHSPAFLMIEATRIGPVPEALSAPQQSDYVRRWEGSGEPPRRTATRRAARAIFRQLPPTLQLRIFGWYQREFLCTLRNRKAFRRIR